MPGARGQLAAGNERCLGEHGPSAFGYAAGCLVDYLAVMRAHAAAVAASTALILLPVAGCSDDLSRKELAKELAAAACERFDDVGPEAMVQTLKYADQASRLDPQWSKLSRAMGGLWLATPTPRRFLVDARRTVARGCDKALD